jgi:histidyl-tRNA synthetase
MFTYADKLGIPYVTVIGEDELKSGQLQLKDMSSGNQEELSFDEIIQKIRNYV